MGKNAKRNGTFMKRGPIAVSLLLAAAFFVLLSGLYGRCPAAQADGKEILARWDDKVITRADLEARIRVMPAEYQIRFQNEEQKRQLLESLVQLQIVAAEAKAQKLDKKKVVAMRIQDMANSILLETYMNGKLASMKKVTDKEVAQYYQSHKKDYISPAEVKAQHILVKVEPDAKPEAVKAAEAKAESIRNELLAGADFAQLAEKYSDDPGSKARGGDLGFFSRDRMVPEFAEAAFSLKKDEISKPVKTGYGFHLIKVTEIKPEKQLDLEEAAPSIRTVLENARQEEVMAKELDRLKKKYKVKLAKKPDTSK